MTARDFTEFGNVHSDLKNGKPAKRLGWPSTYPVTSKLGNSLLTWKNLTRKVEMHSIRGSTVVLVE